MSDLFLAPSIRHRLAAAVRFVDPFTKTPVQAPLDVRAESLPVVDMMPRLPWRAIPGASDATYRFFVSQDTAMPAGAIALSVDAADGDYAAFEAVVLSLPRPIAAHPPTPDRSDFLVDYTLWPTAAFRVPPGETAVVGLVKRASGAPAAGWRVKVYEDGTPPPPAPYAYSDAEGQFLFRLPGIQRLSGSPPTTSVALDVELRPPPFGVVVAPSSPLFPVTVPIGSVSTLLITVP